MTVLRVVRFVGFGEMALLVGLTARGERALHSDMGDAERADHLRANEWKPFSASTSAE